MLRELALFAGAGGGLLASRLLGWTTICAVEIDPYCQRVLRARQQDGCLNDFPIFGDVREFDGREWRGKVDVVSAGFPCQPYSSAARGRNPKGELWREVVRVCSECNPKFVFLENTPRASRILPLLRDGFRELDYCLHPPLFLSAANVGAPHIRSRLWLLAHSHDCWESEVPLDAEVGGLSEISGNVWGLGSTDSLRVVDGMAPRVDCTRALGNGQVPLVAATAWRLLYQEALRAKSVEIR